VMAGNPEWLDRADHNRGSETGLRRLPGSQSRRNGKAHGSSGFGAGSCWPSTYLEPTNGPGTQSDKTSTMEDNRND